MKHPYHTLLPVSMQAALMAAAETKSTEAIDAAVRQLNFAAPYLFHNDKSEALRKFHHEPRQNVPMASFVVAFNGLRY
jgi:hypothetical protein